MIESVHVGFPEGAFMNVPGCYNCTSFSLYNYIITEQKYAVLIVTGHFPANLGICPVNSSLCPTK